MAGEAMSAFVRFFVRDEVSGDAARVEQAARQAADGMDEAADVSGNKLTRGLKSAGGMAVTAAKGLAGVGAAVGGAVAGIMAFTGAASESLEDMGKLETAFTTAGHSAETAQGVYSDFVGILGETDQAVEASNHLAELTNSQKDLNKWCTIAAGVYARFGDSLPLEGLTEAANETAKVGTVTGPLADALNWAGISEDKFNESLAKCTSEQERQQLIMETLASTYGDASAAYKETNADVIAANKANEAWMAAMAEVGAAVEPLITQVKEMGAELLTKLVPVIETMLNNLPAVATALAGIAAALVSYKVAAIAATAAEKGMTLAQYAAATAQKVLNAAMAANPIGLIILAITALVTAFVYLWNNSEKFREFWIKLWDKIKDVTEAVAEWFKKLPGKIYDAIKPALDRVKKWGSDLLSRAKTAASNVVTNVTTTMKNLPGKIYSAISGAIQNVAKWGTDMVSKAKAGMSKVVNTVTDTLKALPKKVLSIGSDLVTGLWNGVNNKLQWLKNKIKSFTKSVLDSIKGFFVVKSPSRETAGIG